MLSKEEIEKAKIGLHNIRADNLRAMQCSLASTEDKGMWLKEIDVIDSVFKYIEQLEADNYEANKRIDEYIEERQKLIEKLEERIKSIDKCYEEMLTDVGGIEIINITGLSKKEKEEVVNKRNCLIVQKTSFKEILEILKGEKQ